MNVATASGAQMRKMGSSLDDVVFDGLNALDACMYFLTMYNERNSMQLNDNDECPDGKDFLASLMRCVFVFLHCNLATYSMHAVAKNGRGRPTNSLTTFVVNNVRTLQ